jgi:hypothetical protein
MKLQTVDIVSTPGNGVNEDRAGASESLAWIIDGATDVVDTPIVGDHTDAAWIATELDNQLHTSKFATSDGELDMARLPDALADYLSQSFELRRRRKPSSRAEHPCAAGIVARLRSNTLEYISLGDCTLMASTEDRLDIVGIEQEKAGDRWVADAIKSLRKKNDGLKSLSEETALWAKLGAARANMNLPDGYGVFSLTSPPADLITTGSIPITQGTRCLLATDGLMRLVDVFGRYSPRGLFEAALSKGLAALEEELRTIEMTDPQCLTYPRAKVSDDATAMLLSIT